MRNRALLIASLVLMSFAGVTTAASATTIKTTAGATVSTGAGISGSLKAGTTSTLSGGSAGNITCSSSGFGASLGMNPATPSVTGRFTSWMSSGCTDTIPLVTVSSSLMGANSFTATYLGASSTLAVYGLVWTVAFTDGRTCMYSPTTEPATAQHNSTTSNNEYSFAAVWMTKTGGTSLACPVYVTWSATYVMTSGGAGITIQP